MYVACDFFVKCWGIDYMNMKKFQFSATFIIKSWVQVTPDLYR